MESEKYFCERICCCRSGQKRIMLSKATELAFKCDLRRSILHELPGRVTNVYEKVANSFQPPSRSAVHLCVGMLSRVRQAELFGVTERGKAIKQCNALLSVTSFGIACVIAPVNNFPLCSRGPISTKF
jgi:hypothetical protein